MAELDSLSSSVFILDIEMLYMSGKEPAEAALRTFLSDWMKRVLTCQGNELARSISLQVGDRLIGSERRYLALEELCGGNNGDKWQYLGKQLLLEVLNETFSLLELEMRNGMLQKVQEESHHRRALPRLLDYRSTTHPEDEAVCLAGMLRLTPQAIEYIQGAKDARKRALRLTAYCRSPSLGITD
ncbi:hypothetical protein SLS58_009018 [Diplodia intermedia]|uniref:Uncharacterized protein n=1 Tax=Diplodia intermedia TaxID=856260 RepID=A0ABR3TFA9_9PEZI